MSANAMKSLSWRRSWPNIRHLWTVLQWRSKRSRINGG
uniref:Uncharacterized protein n=1 Tax=Anguilla anguilla TaxID=7936 RepID=A0A0E9Q9T2_ANGAN